MGVINGNKTYIVGVVAILYILTQIWTGATTWNTALPEILAALGAMSVRHGITTEAAKNAGGTDASN